MPALAPVRLSPPAASAPTSWITPLPAVFAPSTPPRPQERSCWSDESGPDFQGDSFTYTLADGSRVTERYGMSDGDRVIQTRTGETMVCMRAHGGVTFSDDGTRIESLAEGAWIVMASRDARRSVEMIVTPGASGLEHAWYVDGSRREIGPEGTEWRDAMVPVLVAYWSATDVVGARADRAEIVRAAREARISTESARRAAELVRAQADPARSERLRTELSALSRNLDSVRVQREEIVLRSREVEEMARQLRSVGEANRVAILSRRGESDSTRVIIARNLAEVEAALTEVRRGAEERRTAVTSMQEQLRRAQTEMTPELERTRREVAELARRLESGRDAVTIERRLRETQIRLEAEIRRLEEAIRRIP